MGKASKFFKSLLGFKTTAPPASPSDPNKQPNRRWSFVKSHREGPHHLRNTSKSSDGTHSLECHNPHHLHHSSDGINEDPNKHSVALAAATAAVVDAAVAASHAAAEVARMTSRTTGYGVRDELAAVKIQSYFRAYLARRALRALKALVKLQALVRGHILRKQTADMMRRLQALIRAQARACAGRSQIAGSPHSSTKACSHFHHHRNRSKSYTRGTTGQERTFLDGPIDDENDKFVEVDTGKPDVKARRRRLFQSDQINFEYSQSLTTSRGSVVQPTSSSPCASCEMNSINGSTRGGPPTPIKSEGSRSCISGHSDHPNYMVYTESSWAKVRSLSAPRLRPHYENFNATKRDLVYGHRSRPVSTMRDGSVSKGYRGSGRLDRLRMPVTNVGAGVEESELCGGYWN